MKFVVVLEKTVNGFSAFSPDLPGCIATGPTERETLRLMKEALSFHIEGMKEEGLPLPVPTAQTTLIEISV